MRDFIHGHNTHAFLKPGEAIISRNPILVSTILGSCVTVTMYSQRMQVGAICHAMFPVAPEGVTDLHYVEPAVRHIYNKMIEYGAAQNLVVKLFGGARMLTGNNSTNLPISVGMQNISEAKKILEQLRLPIAIADIGGNRGRKLLFSIKTGDVYLRRLRANVNIYWES